MIFESIKGAGRYVPTPGIVVRAAMKDMKKFKMDIGEYQTPAQRLTTTRKGFYDSKAAEILAFASSWTYSDIGSYAYAMASHGLNNNDCVSITLKNDALFVDTSVFILQSELRDIVILSFRGTQIPGVVNWLTNATARGESFLSSGEVHGGFNRAIRSIWPVLRPLLLAAARRDSICDALEFEKRKWLKSCGDALLRRPLIGEQRNLAEDTPVTAEEAPAETEESSAATEESFIAAEERSPVKPTAERLPAIYITGHSLGGALAVLAGAIIYRDHTLGAQFESNVRGIYTYGQPMVGDSIFAREHKNSIGEILFRHVYKRDIVPSLPPVTMGSFEHIGREYHSTDVGWRLRSKPVRRAITAGLSNAIGVASWLLQDVLPVRWLRTSLFSWGHHSPINYLRASMSADPGDEFDPSWPTV